MSKLQDILLDPARRSQVIADCAQLVDEEVSSKGGLGGLAIKGTYGLVKKVKPGIIREAVEHLLEEFVSRMEPFNADFQTQGGGKKLGAYLESRAADVASALLGVTDARVGKIDNRTIKSAYEKLRPSAAKHVEAAVPGIGRVLSKYV